MKQNTTPSKAGTLIPKDVPEYLAILKANLGNKANKAGTFVTSSKDRKPTTKKKLIPEQEKEQMELSRKLSPTAKCIRRKPTKNKRQCH